LVLLFVFFLHATATTEIHTLSLHDALPICERGEPARGGGPRLVLIEGLLRSAASLPPGQRVRVGTVPERGLCGIETLERGDGDRSEEHTSELQSRENLVCRLLLEKKKKKNQ